MNRAIAALVLALKDSYVSHDEKRQINRIIATLRRIEKLRSGRIDDDMDARRLMLQGLR